LPELGERQGGKMKQLIDAFRQVPVTCVSDAMQGMNNMDPAIKPLQEQYVIAGPAVTVQMPAGDNMAVLRGIRQARPGDILVVDAKGYLYSSAAGDFVIGLAQTLGLGGVVIDGTIRDVLTIKASGFPVFCKGATVACSKKVGGGEVNVPISCGGANVAPGDIIVGDANGVAIVPGGKAATVLAAAQEKMQKDEARAAMVLGTRQAAEQYIDELKPDGFK
jgi:regulator of RNase E activity RraA